MYILYVEFSKTKATSNHTRVLLVYQSKRNYFGKYYFYGWLNLASPTKHNEAFESCISVTTWTGSEGSPGQSWLMTVL